MSMHKSVTLIILLLSVFIHAKAQTILVGWDFEDQDVIADAGTDGSENAPDNLSKEVVENDGANVSFPGGNAPSSGEAYSTNNWAENEFVQIFVNTINYTDLSLEFDTRSSNSGPRDFRLEYSLNGAEGPFQQIEGTQFKSPTSFSANPMFYFQLPGDCDDVEDLCIRVCCYSDTSADGTESIGSSGTFRMDNIKILSTLDNPLPVNLSGFNAIPGDCEITLSWTTASEVNNKGFLVYRSQHFDGEYRILDSYEYNPALEGAGNSSQRTTYTYTDRHLENGKKYWYKIADVDFSGNVSMHGPISTVPRNENKYNNSQNVPDKFELGQNFPNPFNPETRMKISIPEVRKAQVDLTLTVFSITGKCIKTLFEGSLRPGVHTFGWDGTDNLDRQVSGGVYFYQMKSAYYQDTGKMLLVR